MRFRVALFVLTVIGSCKGQMQPYQCADGWVPFENYCYLFNNNASARVTWQEAKNECKARQAVLLRIENGDEYNFISQTYPTYPAPSYWTALNNLPMNTGTVGKAAFMWGDDEATDDSIVKAHWDREPDNTDYDDCVTISIQATLSVDTCTVRHGYVCEIQDTQNQGCPQYWSTSDTSMCYFISNVTNYSDVMTWNNAKTACTAKMPFNDNRPARLLSIASSSTQVFLTNLLSNTIVTTQVYWTGLNDITQEGTFVWDSNNAVRYDQTVVAWRQEPNNLGGNEHCGSLVPGARFSDSNCQTLKNYICRMGLNEGNVWNFGCGTWLRAGTKCVSVYSKPQKTWSDARQFCLSQGGDLYKFYDEDDVMWLRILAPSWFTLPGYFIGLNDQAQENTFVWSDGSWAPGTLLDWDREPSSDPATSYDRSCAWISYASFFLSGRCNGPDHAGSICETNTGACAPNWISKGQSCYLFDATWRTRNEGQDFCKANSPGGNGRLLSIDDQSEKEFIKDHLATMVSNGFSGYWTSLTKSTQQSGWYWSDSSPNSDPLSVQKFVDWSAEPNNWNNNEDCVHVNIHGHLNDVVCTSPGGFICQKVLGGTGSTLGHTATWTSLLMVVVCATLTIS